MNLLHHQSRSLGSLDPWIWGDLGWRLQGKANPRGWSKKLFRREIYLRSICRATVALELSWKFTLNSEIQGKLTLLLYNHTPDTSWSVQTTLYQDRFLYQYSTRIPSKCIDYPPHIKQGWLVWISHEFIIRFILGKQWFNGLLDVAVKRGQN